MDDVHNRPETARCDCTHNGNEVLNVKLSIQIDRLFTLLFTDSEFSKDLRQHRRITNFTETPWSTESNIGLRVRYTTSTFPLDYFIGPKSTVVKETQVVQPCSVPGHLYAINIEAVCHGTPFADAYCNQTHYCLRSVTAYETHVVVFSRLYYFKSLPGILKTIIERNYWPSIKNYMKILVSKLSENYLETNNVSIITPRNDDVNIESNIIPSKRTRSLHQVNILEEIIEEDRTTFDFFTNFILILLVLLVLVIGTLYYKLWTIEDLGSIRSFPDINVIEDLPQNDQEWTKLLKKQEILYKNDLRKLQTVLEKAINTLHQSEKFMLSMKSIIDEKLTSKPSKEVLNVIKVTNDEL